MAESNWFSQVGAMIPDLQVYESARDRYFNAMADMDAASGMLKRSFWKKGLPFSVKWAPQMLISGAVFAVVLILVTAILAIVDGNDVVAAVTGMWGLYIAGFVVGVAAFAGVFVLRTIMAEKSLEKAESALSESITILPPKYRNSFCADTFWEMYCNYNVADVSQALDLIDDHLRANAAVYTPHAVMFDAPYAGMSGAVAAAEAAGDSSDAGERVRGEHLPSDIDTHTIEGVDDWEEALGEMIGMDAVKTTVRRMKTRLEFYGESKTDGVNHQVFLGSAGTGKALANDTLIPVNDERGYVPISDLVVGDEVFDERGRPTMVMGVYPQGFLPAYRISFEDDAELICNNEHIFAARTRSMRYKHKFYKNVTVQDMINRGLYVSAEGRDGRIRTSHVWWIPVNNGLQRPFVKLPLDPYVLGVLIGDGCLTLPRLTVSSNDKAVVMEVARRLGDCEPYKIRSDNYSWYFKFDNPIVGKRGKLQMYYHLHDLPDIPEIFGKKSTEKRIPEQYFCGSIEQRRLLLQGLMDTDGSIGASYRMRCTFSTKSEGLAYDVRKLATSLGIRATVTSRVRPDEIHDDNPEFTVYFKCPFAERPDLFLVSEKRERCEMILCDHARAKEKRFDDLYVDSIEKLPEDVAMTCIYVDSPSHLYQAGLQHIVTHNTTVARIVTKMLYDFGYIRENRLVEIDGDYLKSSYAGATGERTQAIVDWARGGVLFIDEAYLLASGGSAAGDEATGVLLKAMEDARDDLVVILAGYEDKMAKLLASNEGFESRIKHKIFFPDYTPSELVEVFELFLSRLDGFTIDGAAKKALEDYFSQVVGTPGFGNAREARGALDTIMDIHADRVVSGEESRRSVFTEADVAEYAKSRAAVIERAGRSAFAADGVDSSIISAAELKSHLVKLDAAKAMLGALAGMKEAKETALSCVRTSVAAKDEAPCVVVDGPAGSGVTSLALAVSSVLAESGYARDAEALVFTADALRAPYVGQTTRRVEAIFQAARGRVLVIDNLHELADATDGFAAEALSAVSASLDTVKVPCVLAGQKEGVDAVLSRNTALARRVSGTVELASVTPVDLCKIVQKRLSALGLSATPQQIGAAVAAEMTRTGANVYAAVGATRTLAGQLSA